YSSFPTAPASPDVSALSLHDALPIFLISNQAFSGGAGASGGSGGGSYAQRYADQIKYGVIVVSTLPVIVLYPFLQRYFEKGVMIDRKSTRLNSSHVKISYAVFCLKKK